MNATNRPARVSERAFSLILALFPRRFRERFGRDMHDLFHDQLCDARSRAGAAGVVRLWIRTLPAMTLAALLEWRDALITRPAPVRIAHTGPVRRDGMLQTLTSDLRFAGRMLRKNPVFTIVAVLAISLGSGAVTTIFSAMNAVVLRPLPGTTGNERLIAIERRQPDFREGVSASYDYYTHLRDHARTLDGLAAWGKVSLSIAERGPGNAVYGNIVSGNFFSVLGVHPALGRFFAPDEDRTPLTHPVIVVSWGLWRSVLGADSGVVGRSVSVNGHPFTLIGVAPEGFRGLFTPFKTDAWVPLMMQGQLRPNRNLSDGQWLWLVGRMRSGIARGAARQELLALTSSYVQQTDEPPQYRKYNSIRLSDVTGLPGDARGPFLGFMGLLLGAAGLVLLIASVNVASMLSARAIARRREMAVRSALGAARARLVRQLLTESLVLFLLGALGGISIAVIATNALERMPIPTDAAISLELSPDPRVLAFALTVSLITGVVFGLAPALQASRKDVTSQLRDDTAGAGTRRRVMSHALVVGQMALSLLLLVGAGLFLRALQGGQKVDPGFDASGVVTVSFDAASWGYDTTKGKAFFHALREQAAGVPGVTALSYTGRLPLSLSSSGDRIDIGGGAAAADRDGRASVQLGTVDAGYFSVLRLPLVSGRGFSAADDEASPRVAVVNQTLARRHWPDGSALGRTFGFRGNRVTIVGIARDAKYDNLAESTPAFVYFPVAQQWDQHQWLLVRTSGDPAALSPALERVVQSIDPALPRPVPMTLQRATSIALFPQRVAALVTGVLGGVGLLLATVGLYGLIAYSASRRTREIGIRLALGARRADVLGLIVREGMRLAAFGVVIGVLLAAAATRLMAGLLFDVSPLDVTTFAGMSLLLVAVALLASYLPARRAAASDPVAALRTD